MVCNLLHGATRPPLHAHVHPNLVMQVAQEHGILLDPIWTLAAWEVAQQLTAQPVYEDQVPVMLHTGGSALALQGLSQRFPDLF